MKQDVKYLVYAPYVKKLLEIQARLQREGVAFNASGARSPAPSRLETLIEYLKFFGILVFKGKASPFLPKYYNFKYHYHLYRTNLFI